MKILYNVFIILILALAMTEQAHTMIVGHRGCRGLLPENTLAAFRHALEMGVDGIELDVHLTKDGKIVVYHDYELSPDLTRDEKGHWLKEPKGPIKSMRLSELKRYRLGQINPSSAEYRKMHPDIKNSDDESLPELKDVLELAKTYPKTNVLIELKTSQIKPFDSSDPEALSKAVIREIDASGIKNRCAILAFDIRVLKNVRQLDPDITLYLNYMDHTLENTPWYQLVGYFLISLFDRDFRKSGPQQAHDLGANYWSSHYAQITPEKVKEAHDLGLKVMGWTVNTIDDAKRLIEMDVDIIATDLPDVMLNLVK